MQALLRFFLMFIMLSPNLYAGDKLSTWYTRDADNEIIMNVALFLSSTCPHCHKADAFFKKIESQTPWLHVQRYVINEDKNALIRFNELLNTQHMDDFAVPSVFFCNSRWVGFVSDETTGKDFLKALNYCKQQIEQKGELPTEAVTVLKRWANANMFDSNMTEHPSVGTYISLMAFMDAVNPCAYFGFAGFLALLFMQDNQKRRFVVGALFILIIGIVHYIQQAHTSTFFAFLDWFRWPAVVVGLFTYYLAGRYYYNIATPSLFIILSFLLAMMIQTYQQTCLMNWSYIFEQWLYNQKLSHGQENVYQFVYQILYLIPPFMLLILYLGFAKTKRFARWQPVLNRIGLLYIMAIGLCLIVYPIALSNMGLSFAAVILLALSGIFFKNLKIK